MSKTGSKSGWKVGYSIPLELMCALELLQAEDLSFFNPPGLQSLRESVTDDWFEAWRELFPEKAGRSEPLKLMAQWSGNMFGENFSAMSMEMRTLTLEDVSEHLGVAGPDCTAAEDSRELVFEAAQRKSAELLEVLDLKQGPGDRVGRELSAALENTFRVLSGGEHHARYWHLLDRFWFEFYKPWRERQRERMQDRASEAAASLGGDEAEGEAPGLDWLPAQNPLRFFEPLKGLIVSGERKVYFLVEPFGLFDYVVIQDDWLIVPFGDPTGSLKEATRLTEGLAARCKALGDPTRVMILRMIRDFSFDNTTMANYLGLARPTVSVHCKILREAGLIETEIIGRQARHRLKSEAVRELFGEMEGFLGMKEGGKLEPKGE
jgi:DNA-binding transcriptional ArsR family regulator